MLFLIEIDDYRAQTVANDGRNHGGIIVSHGVAHKRNRNHNRNHGSGKRRAASVDKLDKHEGCKCDRHCVKVELRRSRY